MRIVDIFDAISSTSKSTEKAAILNKHRLNVILVKSLLYSCDPFKPFHVSTVPKIKSGSKTAILSEADSWEAFFNALDDCSARRVTGNAAINLLSDVFKRADDLDEKWMRAVLKKHLNIGVSEKSINKIFPNLIPTFEVSLAQKFDVKRLKGLKTVAVEPKLDGIRCFTVVRNGSAIMLARSGKPINNFNETILPELIKMGDGCYDGELMGKDFTSLMRQAYRKEDTNTDDTYLALFDFLPLEEWSSKRAKMTCGNRFRELAARIKSSNVSAELVRLVDRKIISTNYDEIKKTHDFFAADGFEGAMIKFIDAPYNFGRGFEVMKLKAFHDVDLVITGLLEGTGKHEGKLGSFQVVHNGVEVQVGSGLTDDLRETIWRDKSSFLGRTIEVRYQEETPDGSLRFPTFVCFRNDRDQA